jgi:hypothetical protein
MRNANFNGRFPKGVLISVKCILLLSSLICSSAANADLSDIKISNNQISFHAISTKLYYSESDNGNGGASIAPLDTQRGDVPGYAVLLSVMSDEENLYFAAEYDRSRGQTTYVGRQPGGGFGSEINTTSSDLTNFHFRLGKGFETEAFNAQSMATLFFEIGNHKLVRNLAITAPYLATYSDNYLVFGGLGQYSPEGSKLVLSANAMWGVTFSPNINTALGSVRTRGNPPTTLCGFSADYEFFTHFRGNISVDVVNFSYVISDMYTVGANQVFAPNNSTDYTMIKLGLGYAF